MLQVQRRADIATAIANRERAQAIYAATAPFHLLEGLGVSFFKEYLERMDAIITPPPVTADPLTDAAVASFETHMRRAKAG